MRCKSVYLAWLLLLLAGSTAWTQENPLDLFQPLMGKTWMAKGEWGDGSKFKQQINLSYDLNKQIVVAKSDGYTNEERTQLGRRNHGIRKWDPEQKKIRFWEFDVFGGVTEGVVIAQGKNILYQYQYGGSTITDMWEYVNDNLYNFKVGSYVNGVWEQVYLDAQFRAFPSAVQEAFDALKKQLPGDWTSAAWDGELIERWRIDTQGNIAQQAEYFENGKVTYRAHNRMEVVADELLLITVIEGSNPKIFKATEISESKVVFENAEYKNPSRVTYQLRPMGGFDRKIEGIENGQPTSYIFSFQNTQ